ncbi:MAG TPA: VWA domain-containing protein [Burkholderiales bacterium]|nr:VWA domain-containing protein [Burkholderiales bacterium]
MTFQSLWPLALLVLLPLIWWLGRRSATNLGARHLAAATALRALTFLLLLLALMQPVWLARTREVSVVYALDVSRSVAPDFVQSALQWIRSANREHAPATARYVVFGERPVLVDDLEQVSKVAVTSDARASRGAVQQGATNIELALDEALLAFDPDQIKRLVLLTDGNETTGNLWRELPRLKAAHVRLFAFPAAVRAQHDAWIESIEFPPGLRRDEPVAVLVRVASQGVTRAVVRLTNGAAELGRQSVRLDAGMNEIVFRTRLRASGAVDIAAEVKAEGDTLPDNDRLQQTAWVGPRARVLYAEGQSDSAHYLRDALKRDGIDVKVVSGAELPQDASALSAYDAVIVSDVARSALDDQRMAALESYVRDQGGGLLYAAGETTYGQSGYSGSVLERVLPVEFKAQEKRKDLALVVCLDRSYSMKGRQMELAKAATRAALGLLDEQHQFGVIAFDSQPHETVPLQPVRSRRRAEDLIDRIQASGQTNIYPALAIAFRWLQNAESKSRHVILLSDGDSAPADFERLVKRMVEAHISVSTVAVGHEADRELMSNIARWGKGRAYYAEDPSNVPQLFIEDTQNVSRATLIEEPFRPVVKHKIEALRGIDFAQAPMLRGFASTKARDGAEVFLESASGAPVLTRWQYGLGRTAVFASDVKDRWAADWLQWDGYGKLWGQLVRDVMRRDMGEELRFSVRREGGDARIMLDALTPAGGWQNRLSPVVRVSRPGRASETIRLRQTAPGGYTATVALDGAGAEPFGFELQSGGGIDGAAARQSGTRRLYFPFPDEYRSMAPDTEALRALAEQTGGKLAPKTDEIFAAGDDSGRSHRPLWPALAAAALVVYLLDIAVRRAPRIRRWLDGARTAR